MNTFDKAG